MRTATVKVTALPPHKGPARGLELQPQQGAKNKDGQGQAWGDSAERAAREGAPLRPWAGPGPSGDRRATWVRSPGGKDEECSGYRVTWGIVGKAGVVWPGADGFQVALRQTFNSALLSSRPHPR